MNNVAKMEENVNNDGLQFDIKRVTCESYIYMIHIYTDPLILNAR